MTSGLSLAVLGTASPYPRPGQPCSGYLLRTPDTSIWIDAGSGTMAELQRHLPLEQIQAIWISHLHPDHYSDLLAAYNWLVNASPSRPPLPVFGPPGWLRRTASLISSGSLERVFVVHELEDGRGNTFGDLTQTARSVVHSVPTFGFRGEYRGRIVAYSADTGPCDSLRELSQHAHLLLCEAGVSEQPPGKQAFHCTPEQAAQVAADAAVEHLVLTHLASAMEPEIALARASAHHGRTSLAQVGASLWA